MRHRVATCLCTVLLGLDLAACAHGSARQGDRLKQEVLALMRDLTPAVGRCIPSDRDILQVRFVLDLKAGRILQAKALPDARTVCDGVQIPGGSGCSVERRSVVLREAPADPAVNECLRSAAEGKAAPLGTKESFTVSYPFARSKD